MKVGDLVRCNNDNDIGIVIKTRKIFKSVRRRSRPLKSTNLEEVDEAKIKWVDDPRYEGWLEIGSDWLEVLNESG
jgi:hypothetical protein